MNNFDSFLLQVSGDEKAEILDALKRVRPQARELIERIETLGPHRGLVIDRPAGIADQLRVISSQRDPSMPVYYTSGEGAKHRLLLASHDSWAGRSRHRDGHPRQDHKFAGARSSARRRNYLAHIDNTDSDDLAVIAGECFRTVPAGDSSFAGQANRL